MSEPTSWHRLFGMSLADFFHGMPVTVELEKDLSLKQQLLDVVLIRRGSGPLSIRLPDGFDELAPHNLVTFKSYQEALDGWALNELTGHYVNYRKQVSPSMQDLLPEGDFRLFAVCVRFPQALARQAALAPVQPGVYEVRHFTGVIRLIVVHELPQQEHNALLHLFSARTDLLRYGAEHYRPHSEETSTVLSQLFRRYRLEATPMPDAMEELKKLTRETLPELLDELSPDELDKLLAALPPKTRAALAQRLRTEGAPTQSEGGGPGQGEAKP
jgi:hypothetical protein